MKKIQLEERRERKKRFVLLSSFTMGIMVILSILQLILSNRLASFGRELLALSKESNTLVYENELLAKEIAKESSIAAISEKAHNLSFHSPSNFLFVEDSESVALLPR